MSQVFVLDTHHQPLKPVHPGRARLLLKQGQAVVYCRYPFTLILKYGFPRTKAKQARRVKGFQTSDLVRAVVTSGTKRGTYVGQVAMRTRGVFSIKTAHGTVTDIHARFYRLVARSDGYSYHARKEATRIPTA